MSEKKQSQENEKTNVPPNKNLKMVNYGFDGSAFTIGVDGDKDGVSSIKAKVKTQEGISELINRGATIEGAKVVDFKFTTNGYLVLTLDSDRDGEASLELEINLLEGLDEAKGAIAG